LGDYLSDKSGEECKIPNYTTRFFMWAPVCSQVTRGIIYFTGASFRGDVGTSKPVVLVQVRSCGLVPISSVVAGRPVLTLPYSTGSPILSDAV
jgi:hypothetical protein